MRKLLVYKKKRMGRTEKNNPRKHRGSAVASVSIVKIPLTWN